MSDGIVKVYGLDKFPSVYFLVVADTVDPLPVEDKEPAVVDVSVIL